MCSCAGSMPTYIYTRRLRSGCYYVGKTLDPVKRGVEHEGEHAPQWILRHGVDKGANLVVVDEVDNEAAIGVENVWTARLMWALGVNNVRGGEKCDAHDYTSKDLRHLSQFFCHHLGKNYQVVDKRLCSELQVAADAPKLDICATCTAARAFNGKFCPTCYFKQSTCWKCGEQGHVGRWCGKYVKSLGRTVGASPVPKFQDDISEEVLIQALEAAEAEFEEKHRRQSEQKECLQCDKPLMVDGMALCFACWQSRQPCFYCRETGHLIRSCPKRDNKKRKHGC